MTRFNQKGQGSLEYLLLIGGAVLVAAIVIGLVVTSSQTTGGTITQQTNLSAFCASKTTFATCDAVGNCIPVDRTGAEITSATGGAGGFSRCASNGLPIVVS